MDFEGRITKISEIAKDTYSIKVKTEQNINYKPGQFFLLDFIENPVGWRAYSIASTPNGELEFIFRVVGKFTTRASTEQVGTKLKLKGPLGKMNIDGKNNVCFMGAGTGIVPFLSLTRHIYKNKLKTNTHIIYTDKKHEYIIYENEWKKMAQMSNINIKIKLTREQKEGYGYGHITSDDIPAGMDMYYIIGPARMVDDVTKLLQEKGIEKNNIELERWG